MKKCKKIFSIALATMITIASIVIPQPIPSKAATIRYFDNVSSTQFPSRLQSNLSQHPWEDGFLDVTKPPYNAAGNGVTDDTTAIQNAVDDAYASNLVVYFPQGTYLVSNQIRLTQYDDNWYHASGFSSQRKFGNLLVGQTNGTSRPVIKLKDNSTVTDNILIMYTWYNPSNPTEDGRAKHYLAHFRGINIDMGNNSNVSALSMDGAQYCTIQDTEIYGTAFNAGIHKIPGAVGSVINVKVTGGNVGILCDSYAPQPLVTSVTLEGQSQYGIKVTDTRESTANIIGFKIISPLSPSSSYRAIYVQKNPLVDYGKEQANIYLQDGSIEVKGSNGVAIQNASNSLTTPNGQEVILKNVYVKANVIVDNPTTDLNGSSTTWNKVGNYAYSPSIDDKQNFGGYIYVNGTQQGSTNQNVQFYDPLINEAPPTDLVSRHSWPTAMPSYDDTNKVSILSYGATPYVHTDDDSIAIQNAINDTTNPSSPNYGKSVFIPRGHFHVKNNILLKKGTKIFGAGKNISAIHVDPSYSISSEEYLLDTENETDAGIIMSDFVLIKQEASVTKGLQNHKYMGFMRIRGNNTVFRDVQLAMVEELADNYYLVPEVVFTDNAGGKFYNLAVNTSVKYTTGGNVSGDYRRALIKNTTNPLTIYQLGVNNAEKSILLEVNNSDNVDIYALKYEEQNRLFKIKDSDNISIIGGYGYYSLVDNHPSIVSIENSSNVYLAGLFRLTKTDGVGEYQGRDWIINGSSSLADDHSIVLYKQSAVNPTTYSTNILTNGGFESGTTNWSPVGNSTLTVETNNIYQDLKSLKVSNRSSANDSVRYDIKQLLLSNGQGNYTATSWVRNLNDIGSNLLLKFEITDSSGTKTYQLAEGANMWWQRLQYQENLTWTGTLSSAYMYIVNENSTETYFIDSVELAKGQYGFDKGTNLLSNGSFENGTTDWSITKQGTMTSITSPVKQGSKALRLSGRTTIDDGIKTNVTNILSQQGMGEYDVSAFVKLGTGIDEKTKVKLTVENTAGVKTVYLQSFSSNDTNWTPMGNTSYVKWSGTLASAELAVVTGANTSDLYVDDVRLVKKGYTPPQVIERVTNGTFETGNLNGWSLTGSPIINTGAYSGTYCAKLTTSGPQALYQTIPVTPGKTYTFSAYTNVLTNSGVLEILNGSTVLSSVTATSSSWTKYTTSVVAPAGVSQLTFKIRTDNNKSIKVDNVSILEQ